MAGGRAKVSTFGAVLLQKVAPEIPSSQEELKVVRTHLEMIGCDGLLDMPWAFKSKGMVTELLEKPPNKYEDTERAHSDDWTCRMWKETYNFQDGDIKVRKKGDLLFRGV